MSIKGLEPNDPSDIAFAGKGAEELRLIKAALIQCFPNLDGLIEKGAGNGGPNAAEFTQLFDDVATLTAGQGTGAVPVGGIVAWHGAVNSVPTGWSLCDGTNGTPNLSDRFIYGTTSSSYDSTVAPETGGSVGSGTTGPATPNTVTIPDHTLTIDNLPAHDHKVFKAGTGSNITHPGTGFAGPIAQSHPSADDRRYTLSEATGEADQGQTSSVGGAAPVTHGTVDISHTHDLTGALPPYYKLAYIMFTG